MDNKLLGFLKDVYQNNRKKYLKKFAIWTKNWSNCWSIICRRGTLKKKIEEFTEYVKTTGVFPEREISEGILWGIPARIYWKIPSIVAFSKRFLDVFPGIIPVGIFKAILDGICKWIIEGIHTKMAVRITEWFSEIIVEFPRKKSPNDCFFHSGINLCKFSWKNFCSNLWQIF